MFSENIVKFFKKNGVLLIQITALLLPFIVFFEYVVVSENYNTVDVANLDKVEAIEAIQKTDKPVNDKLEAKKEEQQSADVSMFEIDEVSQEMLDKNASNPQEMLSGNSACTNFENVHTTAKHTGTISKAKNIDHFKKPLPAMITEMEYTCVDAKGLKQTKFTTMGVAVDSEAKVFRCVQSNSDTTMDNEARFKYIVKTMTHHCGFKLSKHHLPKH